MGFTATHITSNSQLAVTLSKCFAALKYVRESCAVRHTANYNQSTADIPCYVALLKSPVIKVFSRNILSDSKE